MVKDYNIIVAIDNKNGFAKNNTIPWYIKEDLKHFKLITTYTPELDLKNVVIMGRKTFETLNNKPLHNRINIVLTSNSDNIIIDNKRNTPLYFCDSFMEAQKLIEDLDNIYKIFIIGGENIYKESLDKLDITKIYITIIEDDYECDKFFPKISNEKFELNIKSNTFIENTIFYHFEIWNKRE